MYFYLIHGVLGRLWPFAKRLLLGMGMICVLWPPVSAGADEYTVGVIAGLTRQGSTYGRGIVQGAELAVRDINESGGINGRKVKLVIVDDASDPARSAIAMRRLVGESVNLIVGGWGSSQVLSNMAIAERAGIPYIVVGATNPRITSLDHNWVFRVIQTDSVMAKELAEMAIGGLGLTRIAIINDSNAYGRGNRDVFIQAMHTAGIEPVDVQSFLTSERTFEEQLLHIKLSNPDGLAIFGTIPAAPEIMKQARELNITAQFLGTGGLANEALMELAPDASEGTILTSFFDEHTDVDSFNWANRYRREFSIQEASPSPLLAAWEYRAVRYIAAPCLKIAGDDRPALRNCIANWKGKLLGIRNEVHFDETGQLTQPLAFVVVKNGIFQPIELQ